MAVTAGSDMSWLQKGWDKNQGRSSQIRHYRAPAPCEKGASNNSLLQCNKMSVKTKQVDHKARQIRLEYGRQQFEKELSKKEGAKPAPFVTKVQIRKTQDRARLKSAGRALGRKKVDSERAGLSSHQPRKLKEENNNASLESESTDSKADSRISTDAHTEIEDESADDSKDTNSSPENTITDHENSEDLNRNYLYPDEIRPGNVQRLIQSLSRRLRDSADTFRPPVPPTRPMAAYARPTKGEIALSLKGPVLLTPVAKASKAKPNAQDANGQISDRQSKLDPRFFQEFSVGSNGEKVAARPISPASDSVVVTGKQIRSAGRTTWAATERAHAQEGDFHQMNRLCYSCRDQFASNSDMKIRKGRAKSAAAGRFAAHGKSQSCPLPTFSPSTTTLHSRNVVANQRPGPKRGNRAVQGLVSPYSLAVDLDQLNSYDYGSPVPPPSLSTSDDEDVFM